MFRGEGIKVFYFQDIFLLPVYLIAIFLIAYLYRNFRYEHSPLRKYFIPGLAIRIVGALSLGIIYLFYYNGGGDTFYYYKDANAFNLALQRSYSAFFDLLMLRSNEITMNTYEFTRGVTYFHDPSGWMSDKIYGLLSVLTFHSYPAMSVMIAALSFTGAWVLLKTFVSMYPQLTTPLAWAVLFVPSVFFWGSGILKDSITFGCLGWVTYSSHQLFFKRKNIVRNSLILLVTGYIALEVKAYIIISFIPALLLWIFLTYRKKISNQFLRVLAGPSVLATAIGFGFLMVNRLGAEFEQFSLDNVISTSERFQQWHGYLAENANASGYSLGHIDGSWTSIISKIPVAVNVTLFRPYLWEANNSVMLIAALESIFIMGFTLYIFYKNGIGRIVISILSHPDLFFCFFFAIVFSFAVGFTSYNFGALVRYKIPCIPFFLVGLIVLNHLTRLERQQQLKEKKQVRKRPPFIRTAMDVPLTTAE